MSFYLHHLYRLKYRLTKTLWPCDVRINPSRTLLKHVLFSLAPHLSLPIITLSRSEHVQKWCLCSWYVHAVNLSSLELLWLLFVLKRETRYPSDQKQTNGITSILLWGVLQYHINIINIWWRGKTWFCRDLIDVETSWDEELVCFLESKCGDEL